MTVDKLCVIRENVGRGGRGKVFYARKEEKEGKKG